MAVNIDDTSIKYGLISGQCTFCEHQMYPPHHCRKFGLIPLEYWRNEKKCPHKNTIDAQEWIDKHEISTKDQDPHH